MPDPAVHHAAIWLFTMLRFRRSRSREIRNYTRVHLATVRTRTTRNVFAVTPEALKHLVETGLAEAAPEVSP